MPTEGNLSPGAVRRIILAESRRAGVGHIGCALSVVELVVALYRDVLRVNTPIDPLRDRFILSKGHAALTVYAALHLKGMIARDRLHTFCSDESLLGVHPDHRLPGVDFSTGSLGHGLSIGAGSALAARLAQHDGKAVVLLSDAECNEGSVWEAVMFAAHHQLGNLFAIIDLNGQQALGYTRDVMNLEPMMTRWQAFGWDAREVDGHDVDAISSALAEMSQSTDRPHVLIARTVFGRGVSFMEREIAWHYLPMSEEQHARALEEIEATA